MRTTLFLILVASVWLPINVWAQQKPPVADDARASVAPLSYQSAFKDYKQTADTKDTPDIVWIVANREVQDLDSVAAMNMGAAAMKPDMKPGKPHEDHTMHRKGK